MKKIICRLIGHDWSDWKNLNYKNCKVRRVCVRCEKSEERTLHDYKDKSNDRCFVDKECLKCGNILSYENHSWETVEDENYSDEMLASYSDTLYITTIPEPEIVCINCGIKQEK